MKNLSSQKNEPPTVPEGQRNLVEVFLILMRVDQRNKRSKPVKEELKRE
jgi:hypothetical protein